MNNKTIYASISIVVALALIISPLVMGDNVLATKHKSKHNIASQGIGQSQFSRQNSQVVSGEDTLFSGNNLNFQLQSNEGNNALGQQ